MTIRRIVYEKSDLAHVFHDFLLKQPFLESGVRDDPLILIQISRP